MDDVCRRRMHVQPVCAGSFFYFRSISQRGVSFVALLLLCGVTVMHRACTSCSAACAAIELLLAYGWMQISGVSALCSLHYMHLGCVNSQMLATVAVPVMVHLAFWQHFGSIVYA
jgi:hypothetical protein